MKTGNNIKVKYASNIEASWSNLSVDSFIFNGGETQVRIGYNLLEGSDFLINASIQSANDVMELLMVTEAIRATFPNSIELVMPYVPYARQDRRCQLGESFSLKVFTNLINSQKYDKVHITDPHSDVTTGLLNNVVVKSQFDLVMNIHKLKSILFNSTPVSPDAGANKKVFTIGSAAGRVPIRADKIREVTDGSIIETVVYTDDLNGAEVTIWDDICDGGRTFIELAKVLKAKGAGNINLFVTHGIFSKGYDCLFESGITTIYTTNSLYPSENPNVVIIDVWG